MFYLLLSLCLGSDAAHSSRMHRKTNGICTSCASMCSSNTMTLSLRMSQDARSLTTQSGLPAGATAGNCFPSLETQNERRRRG